MERRRFIKSATGALAGTMIAGSVSANQLLQEDSRRRIAMVGTGIRGIGMWGKPVVDEFGQLVKFVGLCDINPGRVALAKAYMAVDCPTYTNFDQMLLETKPEALIVTTVDATHHEFIIKALNAGMDVITEKPLTTDEEKCQAIIDAEEKSGKKVRVTFNYRYSPHRQKMYELLRQGTIGQVTAVDFHWYLDIHHGADYFRRWHRLRKNSGSLLVHKASHHFDLLNWWIDSEPEEVFAYGALEHYGKNNAFRHTNCRSCPYQKNCAFYWDITKDKELMMLYADNEKYDGYLRDGCVWREDIDIFDKMAVQIKYRNKVQVSYSLTTYSPYEGYRISFNGTKGKMDVWLKEMQPWKEANFDEIQITKNFGEREIIKISNVEEGHGGGDARLRKQIFNPDGLDPYRQAAGLRDGVMAILIGIGARKSIDSGKPVKIETLTGLVPQEKRPVS